MDFDDYKNTTAYPTKPKKPYLHKDHSSCDVLKYFEKLKEYESVMVEYAKGINIYQKKIDELYQKFMQDMFNEFGVSDNPKRGLLFSKAWEQGHSEGYESVYDSFSDMVDLIR